MMRASLPATLLLTTLLAACASTSDQQANKNISQRGPLKVHPGLLGQPVPAELQTAAPPMPTAAPAGTESAVAPAARASQGGAIKMDEVGLRTQRSVYFDYNSSELKADFDPALRAHARYLAQSPKARVRIEGNADERGSAEFNNRLGLKRAETVRNTLIGHGAPEKQVKIRTLGETQPKLKGHDEESWAENRRADVVYEKEE